MTPMDFVKKHGGQFCFASDAGYACINCKDGAIESVSIDGDRFVPESEIARLRAELEAARVDAERYRWLEGKAVQKTAHDVYGNGGHWSIGFFSDDSRNTFDAAIDAARGGK